MKIVLFEDTEETASRLIAALDNLLGESGKVVRFEGADHHTDTTYELRLFEALRREPYADPALIVADRDLSKTKEYRGLSESIVRRVADRLAIPQCCYSRGSESAPMNVAEEREGFIAVAFANDENECAWNVIDIANGFSELRSKLAPIADPWGQQTAGETLAEVLGKPEYSDKIALYASGDRNRLGQVISMAHQSPQERLSRLTCLLGYFLWDSVLEYPGVVVNLIAAASYLNIQTDQFRGNEKLRAVFQDARYEGPFSKAKGPLWWRGVLDDIVARSEYSDGRELASQALGTDVARSECSEDPSIPAGYYCMLSKQPVSLKNSYPGLAWFPRGGDLARVSKKSFDELGPWL
jgi:hypothetical protein